MRFFVVEYNYESEMFVVVAQCKTEAKAKEVALAMTGLTGRIHEVVKR